MKLIDATNLIKKHAHAFGEVYKQYNFKDDVDLRDYLDFIQHEPVEWIRGFPMQWKTDVNFKIVRAGFHKLLKCSEVISEYGDEYCDAMASVVWNTFKAEMDAVVKKRIVGNMPTLTVVEDESIVGDAESVHSMHSVRKPKVSKTAALVAPSESTPASDWERKYRILEEAYKEFISPASEVGDHPFIDTNEARLRRSAMVLLNGLTKS